MVKLEQERILAEEAKTHAVEEEVDLSKLGPNDAMPDCCLNVDMQQFEDEIAFRNIRNTKPSWVQDILALLRLHCPYIYIGNLEESEQEVIIQIVREEFEYEKDGRPIVYFGYIFIPVQLDTEIERRFKCLHSEERHATPADRLPAKFDLWRIRREVTGIPFVRRW